MHRCLQIPELIQTVVSYLELEGMPKRDLLAMSLATKHFTELCLDVLWKYLHSVKPLFRLIELNSSIRMDDDADNNGISRGTAASAIELMELARLLGCANWNRFHYYAHRVKHLNLATEYHDIGSSTSTFIAALAISSPKFTLLPRLESLGCYSYFSNISYIKVFAGPMLTSLTVSVCPWPGYRATLSDLGGHLEGLYVTMLAAFREACPKLRKLVLANPPCGDYEAHGEAIEVALLLSTLSPSLHHVVLSIRISSPMLPCLSKLPKLSHLELLDDFSRILQPGRQILDPVLPLDFPSLTHLAWAAPSLDDCTGLLKAFSSPRPLQSLRLEVRRCCDATDVPAFLEALDASCMQDSLLLITIAISRHAFGRAVATCLGSVLFQPLLDFNNIQHCDIECCAAIWDDRFLEAISGAWPHLSCLKLNTGMHTYHANSRLTLPGLRPLAERCTHLRSLSGIRVVPWTENSLPTLSHMGRVSGLRELQIILGGEDHEDMDGHCMAAGRRFMTNLFPIANVEIS